MICNSAIVQLIEKSELSLIIYGILSTNYLVISLKCLWTISYSLPILVKVGCLLLGKVAVGTMLVSTWHVVAVCGRQ